MALTPIHPGEHLAEELEALNMTAAELARKIRVPTNRITQILNGTRTITGDTALRLGQRNSGSASRPFMTFAAPNKNPGSPSILFPASSVVSLPTFRITWEQAFYPANLVEVPPGVH